MRPGVSILLTDADRQRLDAIVLNRNSPQKHVWRSRIVLLTAAGLGTNAIMRATGKSKTCVWRWQERYMADGVDGLVRDKTRPPRIAPLDQTVIDRVVALTNTEPPHEATHWTGETMAATVGISISSVQRIWRPSAPAASVPVVQALPRSGVRRQGAGRRRAVRRSAGPRGGPQHR